MTPKILVFAGSIRPGALSERLATVAAARLKAKGAEVTHISLKDYPMPFVGTGVAVPEEAKALRALCDSHHGLFIVTPEYNSSFPPLLKNALDWSSLAPAGPAATGLASKVVAVSGTSPGMYGALRALIQLRAVLELGFGATLVPQMAAVGMADKVIGEDGSISDARANGMLDQTVDSLIRMAKALNG